MIVGRIYFDLETDPDYPDDIKITFATHREIDRVTGRKVEITKTETYLLNKEHLKKLIEERGPHAS